MRIQYQIPAVAMTAMRLLEERIRREQSAISEQTCEALGLDTKAHDWTVDFVLRVVYRDEPDPPPPAETPAE